eukprot:scaffold661251_cov62-Prasinocladus_malaysianus.AAC.1
MVVPSRELNGCACSTYSYWYAGYVPVACAYHHPTRTTWYASLDIAPHDHNYSHSYGVLRFCALIERLYHFCALTL